MEHDEALALLASLPFIFFHLSNPVLTAEMLENKIELIFWWGQIDY